MRILAYIALGALAIGAALAIGLGTSWFGLVTHRPMAKYAEETRVQTFESSRAHQSGTNKVILDYCLNLRTEKDAASKAALGRFIVAEANLFHGNLVPEAATCVSEANAAIAVF